ncbi:uncharacterized protein LOC128660070 isoform X2 [Bombina bombina]|uniref:uncharacterized protein LOC128660070 isoform X2 n=1 Tax=Bombina bombina TaxID=8345 RepID=UPI00235AC4E6|nr:uncharacterized protein LOC128660070 isoform X2 [Bombina bombina]
MRLLLGWGLLCLLVLLQLDEGHGNTRSEHQLISLVKDENSKRPSKPKPKPKPKPCPGCFSTLDDKTLSLRSQKELIVTEDEQNGQFLLSRGKRTTEKKKEKDKPPKKCPGCWSAFSRPERTRRHQLISSVKDGNSKRPSKTKPKTKPKPKPKPCPGCFSALDDKTLSLRSQKELILTEDEQNGQFLLSRGKRTTEKKKEKDKPPKKCPGCWSAMSRPRRDTLTVGEDKEEGGQNMDHMRKKSKRMKLCPGCLAHLKKKHRTRPAEGAGHEIADEHKQDLAEGTMDKKKRKYKSKGKCSTCSISRILNRDRQTLPGFILTEKRNKRQSMESAELLLRPRPDPLSLNYEEKSLMKRDAEDEEKIAGTETEVRQLDISPTKEPKRERNRKRERKNKEKHHGRHRAKLYIKQHGRHRNKHLRHGDQRPLPGQFGPIGRAPEFIEIDVPDFQEEASLGTTGSHKRDKGNRKSKHRMDHQPESLTLMDGKDDSPSNPGHRKREGRRNHHRGWLSALGTQDGEKLTLSENVDLAEKAA